MNEVKYLAIILLKMSLNFILCQESFKKHLVEVHGSIIVTHFTYNHLTKSSSSMVNLIVVMNFY